MSGMRLVPKRDPLLRHFLPKCLEHRRLASLKIVGIPDAGIGFPGCLEDPVESEQLPVLAIQRLSLVDGGHCLERALDGDRGDVLGADVACRADLYRGDAGSAEVILG
jgi:hypothetical protein